MLAEVFEQADEQAPREDENARTAISSKVQNYVVEGTAPAFGEDGELEDFRQPRHREPCRQADEKGDKFPFRALGEEGVIGERREDAEDNERTEMSETLSYPKGKIIKFFAERRISDGQFKTL